MDPIQEFGVDAESPVTNDDISDTNNFIVMEYDCRKFTMILAKERADGLFYCAYAADFDNDCTRYMITLVSDHTVRYLKDGDEVLASDLLSEFPEMWLIDVGNHDFEIQRCVKVTRMDRIKQEFWPTGSFNEKAR